MSYCKKEGKDTVIFSTKKDQEKPSSVELGTYDDGEQGLIREDGEINWSCPCLGGMATGPCGFEFREAFSCFHHSTADPKGSECYDQFRGMQDCMVRFPSLYAGADKDDRDEEEDVFAASTLGDTKKESGGDLEKAVGGAGVDTSREGGADKKGAS